MSIRTLVGVIADKDGLAQRRDGLRTRSFSLPSLEYVERQERVPITLNHGGPRIGRLEHLELDRQDRLIGVVTVDCNIIASRHDWYFSSGAAYRGDADSQFAGADTGHDVRLLELAVTREPASVSLPAIQVLDGDLKRSYVRQGWGGERSRRELLERAARSAESGGQLLIRCGDPEIVKVPGGFIVDEFVPAVDRSADPGWTTNVRPVGPLRHSAHRGRVLRVY